MIWLTFTLIYIISFTLHIVRIWYEGKRWIFKVGDIIDEIEFYMWCPVLNTITLILLMISFMLGYLITILKLEELWEKFRDIKIKK